MSKMIGMIKRVRRLAYHAPGACPNNPTGGGHNMVSDGPHTMRCSYNCGYIEQY